MRYYTAPNYALTGYSRDMVPADYWYVESDDSMTNATCASCGQEYWEDYIKFLRPEDRYCCHDCQAQKEG